VLLAATLAPLSLRGVPLSPFSPLLLLLLLSTSLALRRSGLRLLLVGGAATARARGERVVEGMVGVAVEAVEEAEGVAVEVGEGAGVGALVAAVGVVEAAAVAVEAAAAVVEVAAEGMLIAVEPRSVEALFPDAVELPCRGDLLTQYVAIFDLDFDAILAAMYAATDSAEGGCYLCVPPNPGIEATALGASESTAPGTSESAVSGAGESALSSNAPTEALHTFTLDYGASRSFFHDSTTLTPLSRTVAVSVADPSGGPVLAHSSMVLLSPAAPSGLLSGLHLPSFSTNLDTWVDQFTPGGQRVTHCTCSRTGRHLATFTRQPGSSLYILATASFPVTVSGQVAASGQVFSAASRSSPASAPCSCRPLSHETLLWHHRLGHPSLPRLQGMASRTLGHERYFLLVVDDYSRYTLVFPLRRKGEVTKVLIDWIRGARRQLSESFGSDLPVLRLHSDRCGEFSSDLLRSFCRAEGIRQTFTLPASPQQNGIAERRIGMVMDVARTSMIHAAAPHILWPFAVQYAVHQINLQPLVSSPKTTPTLRWTGKVGDASVFHVWGSRAFVRDASADKLSSRAVPCIFLGFPPDAPGWQFYHPTSRRVRSSKDITFDESVSYYRLFPYRTAPLPPLPFFLAPGAPLVDPLPPQGPAPSGVSQVDPVEPFEVSVDSRVARGAELAGAGTGGDQPEVAVSGGAEPGGAELEGAEPGGAEPGGAEPERAEYGESTGRLLASHRHSLYDPVPGTHAMTLRPSTAPQPVSLPSPPASSLPALADPESDSLRTASPTVTRLLATVVTDPSFESIAASAFVAELVDFPAHCRLVSASVCPPSVGGECALGTDVLEDRQEEFECFAAAVPHLVSMLLAPEGDPDAPDIPTPRSYAKAIEGPYSSQWQAAMDAEMASWKSTGTYVDEVPPPGASIVSGMWIFRVKRPPGSSPVFKVHYVARGFSQRQGVDFFQTFSPTPKMTTLLVLLHVAAQRDYELHLLDFSRAFLHGSLHEEIWLRRPPGFTGSFPAGTLWSLLRPIYGLRQAPREWHNTLRTTLAALGFSPSTADPSLFLRTDTTLPPFYILVSFSFTYSSPQSTPLPTGHSLSAPPLDKSVEPSGPYPELVGYLMYLMTCTRPDLAYPLSLLARYVAPDRHRKVHWDAAKRVLRYLCSTSGMGLVLGGRARVVLTGHADASWVDDLATQRSSQGYTFSLGSGSVSWRSTRSSSVLSSICEAEIYAGAMAAQELCWLTYVLADLGEAPRSPPVLYIDNKAMLALCQEHRLEHRTKHIALRYFRARELQQRGQLCLAYMASRANTADVFTKALQP
ncbi:unnamed protein product, partial [Closterium sp. NIES-54]